MDELKNSDGNGQDQELNNGESELEKLKKERDEYLDGWQRARAELINHKKDEAKRFEEIAKFSNETLVRELVFVLDTFDLAIAALEKEGKMDKGIYLIKAQLEDVLKNYGLSKVMIVPGQPFDPAICEAVAEVESDKPSQAVVELIDHGYYLNGKLIRPARVKVAK